MAATPSSRRTTSLPTAGERPPPAGAREEPACLRRPSASGESEDGEHRCEAAAELAVAALDWVTARGEPRGLDLNVRNRPLSELRGVREATLAPYGEFWVASADLRDGDLRMEFTGKTDDFDPRTDEALLNEGFATVTPLLGIVAAPLKGSGDAVDNAWRQRSEDRADPVS